MIIKDFLGGKFVAGYFVPVFWLCFGFSLVSITAASLFAIYGIESARKNVDAFYLRGENIADASAEPLLDSIITICNVLSLIFVFLGIIAMAIFVFVNITI